LPVACSVAARSALRGLWTTLALGVLSTVALPVAVARADLVNVNPCNGAALSQPFAPWGDVALYEIAPGGDFERSSWALAGGAQRIAGSEPYAATGKRGSWSLSLPAGSSALSPTTCVDAAYPTIRFFIAGTGSVVVSVLVGHLEIPAGAAVAAGDWLPTPVMLTNSAVIAAASAGTAKVSLRFTAVTGDPRVDDVFIDPWNRG
jgi:hypothetical protein